MKKVFKYFLCFLFLNSPVQFLSAQDQKKIDSLFKLLAAAKEDSHKAYLLYSLGWETSYLNLGEGLKYADQALKLSQKLKYDKGIFRSYHDLGSIYLDMGDFDKANEFLFKELRFGEEMIKRGRDISLAGCYIELAIMYGDQDKFRKALEYDSLALLDFKKRKDTSAIAVGYINTGTVYASLKNFKKALEFQNMALDLNTKMGNKESMGSCYMNIGALYGDIGDQKNSLKYLTMSYDIYKEGKFSYSIPAALLSLGGYYEKNKNFRIAISYMDSSLKLVKQNGQKEIEMNIYENISDSYDSLHDPAHAYKYFKMYSKLKDSLYTDEKAKTITTNEMKYEFEKVQEKEKLEQAKKDATAEQEIRHQRVVRNTFIGGFIIVLILAFYIFREYRQKKKINMELGEKNSIIEEKNKNITDSINYAKHIQNAVLPPENFVEAVFPNSFIFFQPKDIVSGDFYWMERVNDKILFAAVDCTGHGVPGAMVSVVGHNSLNRCIKEFQLSKPAEILDKLNELIEETFEKSEDDIKDGMDIALCSFDPKTMILEYAGANNPLWIIKKEDKGQGTDEKGLLETKANKQPIGKFTERRSFTNHSLQLNKGDRIYIFTDGFADQFGGDKGKKFKYRPFQDLLLANTTTSINEQKKILADTIHNWMSDLEQVDDILIMGIEV